MTREELLQVELPQATSTYSPVSHRAIIETVEEQLDRHGLIISDETYNSARNGQQLIGYMDIKHSDDNDLGMRIAFRNSYDKSMSAAFLAGSMVWICSNGMVSSELQYVRKHTGSISQELEEKVINTINTLDNHFRTTLKYREVMKEIEVNKKLSSELAGRMFIEEGILSSEQMSILKKEINDPSFDAFRDENLWSLYNHTTYGLKKAHPLHYIQDHLNVHNFYEKEFSLTV